MHSNPIVDISEFLLINGLSLILPYRKLKKIRNAIITSVPEIELPV